MTEIGIWITRSVTLRGEVRGYVAASESHKSLESLTIKAQYECTSIIIVNVSRDRLTNSYIYTTSLI